MRMQPRRFLFLVWGSRCRRLRTGEPGITSAMPIQRQRGHATEAASSLKTDTTSWLMGGYQDCLP